MFYITIVTIIVGVVISLWFVIKMFWYKMTSKYSQFYCPGNIPILGTAPYIEEEAHKLFRQHENFSKKGDHIYINWFSWQPVIFSEKVEHAKFILGSQEHTKKSFFYFVLHEWLNTGLLTSYGEKWKQRRRILTPSFHFSILNEFVPSFEKAAKRLVDTLMNIAKEEKVIDIQIPLSLMTLESMTETSMAINDSFDDSSNDSNNKNYVKDIISLGEKIRIRAFKPWLWPSSIFTLTSVGKEFYKSLKYIHEYTLNAIKKRIAIRTELDKENKENNYEENKRNVCFIDTLIDSYQKGDIDINGIREEVDTFIFEGHDTTSSALTFCFYALGRHQEYQRKVQKEIDETEGNDILEIIPKLEFLDCVFKESMRLYPPVPLIGRSIEKDTIIDNESFYKGATLAISIIGLHRNENYWENPLEFNPYRFMGENYQQRNPYSYIPFSAGPRNCIGQKFALLEIKICLYHILKNFNLTSIQKEDELHISRDMILLSTNGVLVKFETR